ncbi:alpha-D-ribose 1-methylphosphonate 5-phosphate C-P lyase [Tamaricihabitans halophyticus]|uniref:Alpha-D-ribose 1-methylphosphonate 5-phosphate C-P lyase n=1 Tax=Tamaricihabitans halophyticus TaxID=1262583 RepID=A0A4R2QUG5_9PSEU|nr:alpha-D-ribose 1-methylphosphonate 5-phosphate C-P-lyase PhnJ [Tamaricihabitans halophyticus]TCP53610.1 alpha-D-ribose 1-methylphosphonate 5-phosphate C-P lyase [Tamaricihabitans halophyticus]
MTVTTTDASAIRALLADVDEARGVRQEILDEGAKREVRRAVLSAVCVPGYQVPFGSREMPVARGWGSGGLQVTLGVIGPADTVKVIDQGDDAGVNATNLRRMIGGTTDCAETTDTRDATVIQSRHRIPEEALGERHIMVYQVPVPEPLRGVEKSVVECGRMHAEADYSKMWVSLYEDIVRNGLITASSGYPVEVDGRYVMATSPVPRWDVPRLHQAEHLNLYGAGREKRIYAIPPHTDVHPLTFADVPFEVEYAPDSYCKLCGSDDVFLVEGGPNGGYVCSDTEWCTRVREGDADIVAHRKRAPLGQLPDPRRRLVGTEVEEEVHGTVERTADTPEWALRVSEVGKVHGSGGAAAVPGTGPESGSAVSPSTGAIVAAWDVDFDVAPGEALGLIGESGSGKSTVLSCVVGDVPATSGTVRLGAVDAGRTDVLALPDEQRRKLRIDSMAVVYQDPAAGLNLDITAGGNIAERLTAAGWRGYHRIRRRAAELLDRVEVPLSRMDDPVRTFSGGMRQRVQIAKALATEPAVLLLDEPTTGLDASVAAGVIDLLRGLLAERDIAAVVVSHDFAVIEALTDRTLVMQLGRVVERGLTDQLFHDPHHPYTQRLVAAARR